MVKKKSSSEEQIFTDRPFQIVILKRFFFYLCMTEKKFLNRKKNVHLNISSNLEIKIASTNVSLADLKPILLTYKWKSYL